MRKTCAGLALLVLMACSGSGPTTPVVDPVNGAWNGSATQPGAGTFAIALTLSNTNGTVTGSGALTSGTSYAEAATGTYADSILALKLSAPNYAPTYLTCTIAGTVCTGTMTGAGFNNAIVTMTRH